MSNTVAVAMNSYLTLKENNKLIWTCPNRSLNLPHLQQGQWYIGYAYFGGIERWSSSPATPFGPPAKSYSPVKLGTAKPYWTLGADANIKVNNSQWSGAFLNSPAGAGQKATWGFEYDLSPPHRAKSGDPDGGNEVFADGSARWCKFDGMYRFESYVGAIGTIDFYWFQEPNDFDQALINKLTTLK
jgi:hypothetical protein